MFGVFRDVEVEACAMALVRLLESPGIWDWGTCRMMYASVQIAWPLCLEPRHARDGILKKARARQSLSRKLKANHVLVTTRDNGGILRSSYTPVMTPLQGGGSTEGRCLDPSLCGQTFVPHSWRRNYYLGLYRVILGLFRDNGRK